MDIRISPSKLKGRLIVPPSKSISHRMLIGAAFAEENSMIDNLLECEDTHATIDALTALGAEIHGENGRYSIKGISASSQKSLINCRESGSTLRFMIPICSAYGCESTFTGAGKLPERPITPLIKPLSDNGITFVSDKMPYMIKGRLKPGKYYIDGSVSSQFITGLLYALSLLEADSEIILTSKLESRPYVDITIDCMKKFGIDVIQTENGFHINGAQKYNALNCTVEADMSQCAFFVTANCLGAGIDMINLNKNSVQGDKAILDIADKFINGGDLSEINAGNIPDLVPILTVLMSFWSKPSVITDCGRLRIKECDRLAAITEVVNTLGGNITEHETTLEIKPVKSLNGGVISSWNDHRIAMAAAIAATRCENEVIIKDAQCISKSYPAFFEDYKSLGGIADVI